MLYNYEDNFNVLERFEHNEYQNILMGVDKNNPDDVVVINLFKKSVLIQSDLADLFKDHLSSLVMLEETDDEIIVITKYHEGMPLKNYLDNYDTTLKSRINFAYEFLKKISIYDSFNHFFKRLFIDEDQIIMKNDELLMNELLVIDQPDEMMTADFNQVCQKIGLILDNIISSADNASAKTSILEFIHNLKTDEHEFTDLNQIHDAFKKIYIYDMYLDESQENDASDSEDNAAAFIGGAAAGAVGGAILSNNSDSEDTHSDLSDTDDDSDWESDLKSAFGRSDEDSTELPIETLMDTHDKESEVVETDNEVQEAQEPEMEETPPSSLSFEKEEPTVPLDEANVEEEEESPTVVAPIFFDKEDEAENVDEPVSDIVEDEEEDFISPEEEEQLQALFAQNTEEKTTEVKEKRRGGFLWIFIVAALILAAIFAFNSCQDGGISSKEQPVAHIVKTRIGDVYYFENKSTYPGESVATETNWKLTLDGEVVELADSEDFSITLDKEGKYIVELKVKNNNNVWSETESHEFFHVSIAEDDDKNNVINTEKLDNYTVTFENDDVSKDDTVYRNGSYSFKMDFDEKKGEKSFTIQDTFLDDKAIISLWIRSSNTKPISLSFKGYNNKNLVFINNLDHIPTVANQWEMKQFSIEVDKLVDSIEVIISAESGQVWIDDFAINSYK